MSVLVVTLIAFAAILLIGAVVFGVLRNNKSGIQATEGEDRDRAAARH